MVARTSTFLRESVRRNAYMADLADELRGGSGVVASGEGP
jgi:hypothetical protein